MEKLYDSVHLPVADFGGVPEIQKREDPEVRTSSYDFGLAVPSSLHTLHPREMETFMDSVLVCRICIAVPKDSGNIPKFCGIP
jgi:hypothetical protein